MSSMSVVLFIEMLAMSLIVPPNVVYNYYWRVFIVDRSASAVDTAVRPI
jgi:hypothetical protein